MTGFNDDPIGPPPSSPRPAAMSLSYVLNKNEDEDEIEAACRKSLNKLADALAAYPAPEPKPEIETNNDEDNRHPHRPVLSIINPFTEPKYKKVIPPMPDYPRWHPTSVLQEYQHRRGLPHSESNMVLVRFFNATGGDVRRMPTWVRQGHVARMGWLEYYWDQGFWARLKGLEFEKGEKRRRLGEFLSMRVKMWLKEKQKEEGKEEGNEEGKKGGENGVGKSEDDENDEDDEDDEEDEEMLRFLQEEEGEIEEVEISGGTHDEDELETQHDGQSVRDWEIEAEKALARELDELGLFGDDREIAIKLQADLDREWERAMKRSRKRVYVLRHPKLHALKRAEPWKMLDNEKHVSKL
ncbi:MAG: hypothetical protein Q9167_006663 [Letrouitia subvulpina]